MPTGRVTPFELGEAIKDRLSSEVVGLEDVRFIDVEPDQDSGSISVSVGRHRTGAIVYYNSPAMTLESAFAGHDEWAFHFLVTVFVRKSKRKEERVGGEDITDSASLVKEAMLSLQGERLGVLNVNGLSCGGARNDTNASGLQVYTFSVSGRSREIRS